MASHLWSLMCRQATIDSRTQSLSILDVYDDVHAHATVPPGSPIPDKFAVLLDLTLVSVWERSNPATPESKVTFQVRIASPSKKELGRMEQVYSMEGPHLRNRNIIAIRLGVEESGRYEFHIEERKGGRWRPVVIVPINVNLTIGQAVDPAKLS